MKAVWLVARRELKTRLLAKATIISTIIFMVLIAGGIQVTNYFVTSEQGSTTNIGASQEMHELAEVLPSIDPDLEVLPAITPEDAGEHLEDGEIDMYIGGEVGQPTFSFDGDPDPSLIASGTQAAQQYARWSAMSEAGVDPQDIEQQATSITPQVVDINPVTSARDIDAVKVVTAFVSISLLLFALIQSASLIIMGVIEEKSSRVVEILLATIRPGQLLAGKVLGIGIMALIQVVLFALAGVTSASVAGLLNLGDLTIGASVVSLLGWFLLGFGIYVTLFGGLASLVSRQEDAGVVTTPMIFGLMIPFYVGIYLIPNAPDALVTKVLSLIPLFSPFMMPIRAAFEAVSGWEIILAVLLCLATIPAMVWVGGRVYSRAVLHTGGRVKLREALR